MPGVPQAHQQVQSVLAKRGGQYLQLVAQIGQLALEGDPQRQLVLHRQVDPPRLEHPRGVGEAGHVDLLQTAVTVEFGRVGIVAHDRDAVGTQVAQAGKLDTPPLALQQANAVAQVGAGKLPVEAAGGLVPGAQGDVVVTAAHAVQGTRPGYLLEARVEAGALERGGHQFHRQAVARHARIDERRPGVADQAQVGGRQRAREEQCQQQECASQHEGASREWIATA